MARPLRFQYPGAIYHVIARGDGGKAVFESDDGRLAFLKRLVDKANPTVTIVSLDGAVRTTRTSRPGVTAGEEIVTRHAGRRMAIHEPGISGATTSGYDALGREVSRKDPRHTQASVTAYVPGKDQIASETDAAGHTTSYTYHAQGVAGAGKVRSITLADNSVKWFAYTTRGELMATWGSQTYPTWREYNAFGQLTKLHTWQTAPTLDVDAMPATPPAGSAVTTWNYDPRTGLLASKRYDDGKGPDYYYDLARRLTHRQWARTAGTSRLLTVYGYSAFGELTSTNYSDVTPDVVMTYDRLGRAASVSNGVATSAYAYDSATLLLDTETISYDLDGDNTADFTRVLDRSRDAYLRASGWQLRDGTTVENEVAYRYDTGGRFGEIESPAGVFTYSYTPGSPLLASITGPAHTVENTWEPDRDVLALKQNKVGVAVVSSYGYSVNAIGQRTSVAQTGTAFSAATGWNWGYDALGQVTSAEHGTSNAFDRAYEYDAIGNRRKSADSLTLPGSDNYTSNALNQYTAVDSLNPGYDDDGNATAYPVPAHPSANSTLVWDAENRLISATVDGTTTTYLYDAFSRRFATTVGTGGPAGPTTTLYLYDAWNPIAEYSYSPLSAPSSTLTKSYTWGLDLSGALQGAGGLLAVTSHPASPASHYPTYDGNGNVSEYVDATGAVAAHYEYDPFGRIAVATGASANDFAHRFSTKPLDEATGLYYYGYRYYDPVTGRWPSKDPIEERGGVSLYGFVGNDGLDWIDFLGREVVSVNGEKWNTPSVVDANHIHTYNGVDQGPHMHGPNGQKFFPETGMMLDKNGKWKRGSNKFLKAMQKGLKNSRGRGLGAAGLMALAGLAINEANGENCAKLKKLKDLLEGALEGDELDAAEAMHLVQELTGSDTGAVLFHDALK